MNHLWSTQKEHLCTLTRHISSCFYISLFFLFWSEGYTNLCTAFCSWVSQCRRKTLLSHWGSASDSDSSPKHFLRTSHSLHLSKQLERTAARVTGGRVRHRDCITPCWLLHTGRVCVCERVCIGTDSSSVQEHLWELSGRWRDGLSPTDLSATLGLLTAWITLNTLEAWSWVAG